MADWWNALTSLERFFALVAIPSTLLLVIQTLLTLFGLGSHHDHDNDAHGADDAHDMQGVHDAHLETGHFGFEQDHGVAHGPGFEHGHDAHFGHDHHGHGGHGEYDHGLRIFTLRGLVAFFSIFGWCGLACLQGALSVPAVIVIATLAGLAAMLSIALLMKAALRLQSNGTVSLANAVGKSASVYIRIPARRAERGKVNVTVQDCYVEADAVTDSETDLPTGYEVTVIGLVNPNTLLVAVNTDPR